MQSVAHTAHLYAFPRLRQCYTVAAGFPSGKVQRNASTKGIFKGTGEMLADLLMLQLCGSVQIIPHVEWFFPV